MIKQNSKKQILTMVLVLIILTASYFVYRNSTIIEITDEDIALSGGIGVTPQMFGAKGDGITDDSKSVQSAIDYASKNQKFNIVYIPEGVYSVKNLKLKQNVKLLGVGEKSVLLANPSIKKWNGILSCKELKSVHIEGITFDGNKPIVPGNTKEGSVNLWITSCSEVTISKCIFQNNLYLGIALQDSTDVTIEDSRFINLDCGVITSNQPSSNLLIQDNYFDGAEYSEPISIYGQKEGYHENITIINNQIKNHTKGSGIMIRAAKNVIVKNNEIENCSTGIYTTSVAYNGTEYGVYNATIEENTISNTVCEGILIKNINDSVITNNTVTDAGTYGLFTRSVKSSEISYNKIMYSTIRSNYTNGFSMTMNGVTDSKVYNNNIHLAENELGRRNPIKISDESMVIASNNFEENQITPIQ